MAEKRGGKLGQLVGFLMMASGAIGLAAEGGASLGGVALLVGGAVVYGASRFWTWYSRD